MTIIIAEMILQVHIVQRGAVKPLIKMLKSPDSQLKEMSAFALGRLAQVCDCMVSHYLIIYHLCLAFYYMECPFFS